MILSISNLLTVVSDKPKTVPFISHSSMRVRILEAAEDTQKPLLPSSISDASQVAANPFLPFRKLGGVESKSHLKMLAD